MLLLSYSLLSYSLLNTITSALEEFEADFNQSDLLPFSYDSDKAPVNDGQPVIVGVVMTVLSITPDSGSQQSFHVDCWFNQYWTDYRLLSPPGIPENGSKITLSADWKDRLWVPDTYFRNAVTGSVSNILSPSLYFTITNRKEVYMATRLYMKLSCSMDFKKYPFDTNKCSFDIRSLSENTDSMLLEWWAFRFGSSFTLPEYTITPDNYENYTKTYIDIGSISCLVAYFHMDRNIGNYIIKRYVPSFLIVIMTFLGFWIPTSVPPARVSLIITALLALIAQQIQQELNVSYVYALEVWMMVCIIFVFATLIEYVVAVAWPYDEKEKQQTSLFGNYGSSDTKKCSGKRVRNYLTVKPGPRNCSVDIVSRVLFPSVFGAAIIIYSLVYYYI